MALGPAGWQDTQNALYPEPVSPWPPEAQRIGSSRVMASNPGGTPSPSAALYRQLRQIGLDPAKVYKIRGASIDREDVHMTLEDGVIAFTEAVDGRVTGAFFEGEGEVLLVPPDRVEKRSLGLFTKAAILEEKFTSAFLRFNDETAAELDPYLRTAEQPQEFVSKWNETVQTLAESDALRLLLTFLNAKTGADGKLQRDPGDRMLRARLAGTSLGVFDLFFDTTAGEQIVVGQLVHSDNGLAYYNVWTAFPMRSKRMVLSQRRKTAAPTKTAARSATPAVVSGMPVEEPGDRVRVTAYKIRSEIKPPTDLEADAQLSMTVRKGGDRVLLFELSRYLKVNKVECEGAPIEFLQNEALEGTQLSRRGNDIVAVVFAERLKAGQDLHLRFTYAGPVMSDAGGGLMYVGARGIWYPNRGMSMADYDLEFSYPSDWTLVATGKRVSQQNSAGQIVAHWVAERPTPLAGFNLGHYSHAQATAGQVAVEVYAAPGMERSFPTQQTVLLPPPLPPVFPREQRVEAAVVTRAAPAPASNAQMVAERISRGVEQLSQEMGPYPYGSLTISQMPGRASQGWPTLVFLSSYVFLNAQERQQARLSDFDSILFGSLMPVHETAHQWWGDLVGWKSYRDQWIVEALANYCALAAIEKNQSRDVQDVLNEYRRELLAKNKDGDEARDAGPVTLGIRLYSSLFHEGYESISYGRGTWLLHMLRTMMRDADSLPNSRSSHKDPQSQYDEPFFRALLKLRQRYEGKQITDRELQEAFEEELPDSLRYEGRKSLDWFFDEWVNGTAIPRLELADVKYTASAAGTQITGKIRQKEAPNELVTSVPVYGIAGASKTPTLLGRVFADGPETTFHLTGPAGTHKLVLDPYQTVLTRP